MIKPKKFMGDMGEVAMKICAVLVHALYQYGEKLRKFVIFALFLLFCFLLLLLS